MSSILLTLVSFLLSSQLAGLPPKSVVKMMEPGGISLHYWKAPIGSGRSNAYLHLYCVPVKVEKDGKKAVREDVVSGMISFSPFYLDVFLDTGKGLRRVNTARFKENADAHEPMIRWLRPKERTGPVVILKFGVGDAGAWHLITFHGGLHSKPSVQEFGYGGDQTYMSIWHFDHLDRHGTMMLQEEYEDEETRYKKIYYRWNGRRFSAKGRE